MSDPTMTEHARRRCSEMGISTKVAKAIVKNPSVTYDGNRGRDVRVYLSAERPEYAVVAAEGDSGATVIVTVLFRTEHQYVRDGSTFTTFALDPETPSKES